MTEVLSPTAYQINQHQQQHHTHDIQQQLMLLLESLPSYLPPYRSLLTPHMKYDYQLHRNIELTTDELNNLVVHNNNSSTHHTTTTKIKMKYRSLLTDTKKKLFSTINKSSLPIVAVPKLKLNFASLPDEVLELVLFMINDDQRTLVNCLYVNKKMYRNTKKSLYYNPFFTSTYRVGQFVTTLQQDNRLGKYVKILDLSNLKPGLDIDFDIYNVDNLMDDKTNDDDDDFFFKDTFACWRDWKYRDNPLYGRRPGLSRQLTNTTLVSNGSFKYQHRSRSGSDATLIDDTISPLQKMKSNKKKTNNKSFSLFRSKKKVKLEEQRKPLVSFDLKEIQRKPYYEPFIEQHPLTNKFLNKYSITKDLPIGYLIHLLTICTNIKELNLSNLSISLDFRILPKDIPRSTKKSKTYDEKFNNNNNSHGHYYIQSLIPLIQEEVEEEGDEVTKEDQKNIAGKNFDPHYKSKNLKQVARSELSTNLIFLSDVGVSTIDSSKHHKAVKYTSADIIENLNSLPYLTNLNLNNCIWLDKKSVIKFLNLYHHKRDLTIDFINSGMIKNSNWGIKGNVRDLVRVFKTEERMLRNWESMYSLVHRIGENY